MGEDSQYSWENFRILQIGKWNLRDDKGLTHSPGNTKTRTDSVWLLTKDFHEVGSGWW